MAKFSLKKAKAEAEATTTSIDTGYYRVVITQVVELGLQRGFNPGDEPKKSIGVVFETAEGQQITKTMPLNLNPLSNFTKLMGAVEEIDELADLLGKELDVEIEANGDYPKIKGYFHIEDQMSGGAEILKHSKSIFYSVDNPQPEVVKSLHVQMRQAISSRVRIKG